MKKFKKAFLLTAVVLTVLLCFVFSVSAADGSGKCGENVFWSFDVETKTLTISGTGPMDDFELVGTDDIDGFVYSTSPFDVEGGIIDTVIIEEGVTSVGTLAFYDFNIENLIVADSVKIIKDSAFYENTRLKTLNLGNGLEVIETSAFYYCRRALESVVLPESLTTIKGNAFGCCNALKEVQISKNLSNVSGYAFSDCDKLEKFIVDEENPYLCDIDGVLFSKDKKILVCYPEGKEGTSYSVADGVTDIGTGAFYYNSVLKEVILPDSLLNIGDSAFFRCQFEEIALPEGLINIRDRAFYLGNLKEIILPESLEYLGIDAFGACPITEVVIPLKVKSIDSTVFIGCKKLEKITVDEANEYYCNDSLGVLYNKDKTELVKYPDGNKCSAYVIPDGVISIAEEAMYSPVTLKTLTVPVSVEKIGRGGFNLYSVKDVYYKGTQGQWDAISGNVFLPNAAIHYNYNPDKLGRPEFVNATSASYAVKLEWKRVPDALGYRIYMKTADGWKALRNTTCDYYTKGGLEPLTEYTFAVRAGKKVDGKTVLADSYTTVTVKTKPAEPPAPEKITVIPGNREVTLKWNPCEGATGYRIYDRVAHSNPWSYETSYEWVVIASSITTTSYTVKNLEPGQQECYAVRPYNKTGNEVTWGKYTVIFASPIPGTIPGVTAEQNTSAIRLTWKSARAEGYRIYYKSGNQWKVAVSEAKGLSHTFTGLKPGAKYTFAIRPYREYDGKYYWADYTEYTTATKPEAVTVKVNSPSKGKLTLTWNAVRGAEGYQVFYKTGNGSYQYYNTYTNVKNLTFTGLKSGTKYTFAVRAGVRTDGGNIFGGYKEVPVTVK